MDKKKDKSKLIQMIPSVLVGVAAGFLMVRVFDGGSDRENKANLAAIAAVMGAAILSYIFGLIIHEGGHLVMGLLTGYRFVSFRVGNLSLVKQNGKLVLRKFKLAGTGGQCLMTHDMVEKDEDIPYFWYHAGGGLFNFITAGICCLVFLNSSNKYVTSAFQISAIISAFLGLINLLPLGFCGIPNDGTNILAQKLYPKTRRLMLNALIVNERQCQGETLDEMPDSLFEGGDPSGGISEIGIELNCAARELERRDFESAKARYKAILGNKKLVEIYRNETGCELLFCEIVTGDEPAEKIDERYESLKKYIELSGKNVMTRHRLMFAYYYIYKHDEQNADKEYNLAAKMSKKYYCPGEARAEMALIEYIKENY